MKKNTRRLSAADADARMQHFLKCLKFQRIYEAARRHGWYRVTGAYIADQATEWSADRTFKTAAGTYRIEQYDRLNECFLVRKVA